MREEYNKCGGINMYLDKEITFFNEKVKTGEEAIRKLARKFMENNLVKDTFCEAVINREVVYPTGLSVNGKGIAIPHTDSIHIIKPQIGFMSLKEPVIFKNMVDKNDEIKVNVIFMLGLKKSEEQVQMLQKLVDMFQNEELLNEIISCTNISEFKAIMKKANIS